MFFKVPNPNHDVTLMWLLIKICSLDEGRWEEFYFLKDNFLVRKMNGCCDIIYIVSIFLSKLAIGF